VVDVADRPVSDTDVLIDYLRGAADGATLIRSLGREMAYRVRAVAAFDLALRRAYARDPGPVHVLLTVECLRLDRRSALRAGSLLRSLREGGRTLEVRDVLQAGIYLEAGATLITRNLGHYSRVPGLKVLAPAQLLSS
jgi:predicted nucleic acid-binding protein